MTTPAASDIRQDHASAIAGVIVLMALLSGLVLLWPLLGAGPLVLDEHVAYWIVGPDNPGTLLERSLDVAATPPLSFWMQRAAITLFGESELVFRAPSAVCYLLAIGVTFLLGRELLGDCAGALAALLVAWHPGVLDQVRIGRPYGATLFLAALAFWMTARWKRQPQSRWTGVGWVAANGALLWTHYVNLPAILLQFVILTGVPRVLSRPGGPSWGRLMVAAVALVGISVPLWPSVLRIWEWSPFLNFMRTEPSFLGTLGTLWWAGLPAGWVIAWLCSLRIHDRAAAVERIGGSVGWLMLWSVVPLLGLALVSRGDMTSLASPRYQVVYAVPAACLIAAILSWKTSRMGACLGCLSVIAVAWSAAGGVPWKPSRLQTRQAREWVQIADILQEQAESGEPLLVQSGLIESSLVPGLYDDPMFMDYVACRAGRFYIKTPHPRYGLPFFWENNPPLEAFFANLLDEACATTSPVVWVAAATDTDLNQRSVAGLASLLRRRGYTADVTHEFESAVLMRYRCGRSSESRD